MKDGREKETLCTLSFKGLGSLLPVFVKEVSFYAVLVLN